MIFFTAKIGETLMASPISVGEQWFLLVYFENILYNGST